MDSNLIVFARLCPSNPIPNDYDLTVKGLLLLKNQD